MILTYIVAFKEIGVQLSLIFGESGLSVHVE